MAVKISITEILTGAASKKTVAEKVDFLRSNDSTPLRVVLKYTYDNVIEFLLPNTPPPFKKNKYDDEAKALLYTEARRLKIFIKGGGYDHLKDVKREALFIGLLEDVDNDDADSLCQMITKKPFKGLSKKTIQEAFPDLIQE
jgi:hypothetical protein|tara:strand:+ start:1470 stop:1895 length:426 start_codon:yes stop_codon:yes gene_type:complete